MSRARRVRWMVAALAGLWLVTVPMADAADSVSGKVTMKGATGALTVSYVDESPANVMIVLASKQVPPDAVPFIGDDVARKFAIHALVFTVPRGGKALDPDGVNGVYGAEHGYYAMRLQEVTLQLTRFDAQGIEGRVFTPKPVELMEGSYEFDATFSIPLGTAAPAPAPVVVRITGDETSAPTAAYAAYYRAVHAGDAKKIRQFLAATRAAEFDKTDAASMEAMLDLLKSNPPEVHLGTPVVKGATATFTVRGVNLQTTTVTAEVTMVREGGAWKVDRERWSTGAK